MKAVFKVVAWFGIVLTLPFILWGFYFSFVKLRDIIIPPPPGYFKEGSSVLFFYAQILFTFGTILIVIGGSFSKPKHFALTSILVGFLYVSLVFGGYIQDIQERGWWFMVPALIVFSLPGLICIIEGVMLKLVANRAMPQQKKIVT